jgi:hypothetical protein
MKQSVWKKEIPPLLNTVWKQIAVLQEMYQTLLKEAFNL